MTEHIPAWKKIGLKVKETLESDPLSVTTHLDSSKVTKKQVKQINKRKLEDGDGTKKEKKTAKRVKLPKSERAPPPEKDQLVYLRTYSTDKENWKFSKQKQNWIIKHIKVIDEKYEDDLVNYLEGLQGGGRDRLVESLKKVTESWNNAALEDTSKNTVTQKAETEANAQSEDEAAKAETKFEEEKQDLESVDADYAKRARRILQAMTEEKLHLKGIDDEVEGKKDEPIEERIRDDASETQVTEKTEEEAEEQDKEDKELEESKKDKKEKKKSKKTKKSKDQEAESITSQEKEDKKSKKAKKSISKD